MISHNVIGKIIKISIPILIGLLSACTPRDKPSEEPVVVGERAVFVCNEGNFMYGNASLSLYDPELKKVANQVFYNTNDFPLGDVLQSMIIIGSRGYLCINNSGKVIVIDINTNKYIATIKGLTSPRYIAQINDNKIYISDLYSRSITIADPTTYKVTGYVDVGRSTEEMVQHGRYLYACSWSYNNRVYKIDTQTDTVVDSIELTKQPNSMVLDKKGKIWVLSDGGYVGSPYQTQIAALTRIDAESFTIEERFDFPDIKCSPSRLSINATQDTLYYINGGVGNNLPSSGLYRISIDANALPHDPFIAQGKRLFYGLGIDPATSEIYLSDAIDYVQQGLVMRYSAGGTLLDQFKVDITPGAFCFKNTKAVN